MGESRFAEFHVLPPGLSRYLGSILKKIGGGDEDNNPRPQCLRGKMIITPFAGLPEVKRVCIVDFQDFVMYEFRLTDDADEFTDALRDVDFAVSLRAGGSQRVAVLYDIRFPDVRTSTRGGPPPSASCCRRSSRRAESVANNDAFLGARLSELRRPAASTK